MALLEKRHRVVLWLSAQVFVLASFLTGSNILAFLILPPGASLVFGYPDFGPLYGPFAIIDWSIRFSFPGYELLLGWAITGFLLALTFIFMGVYFTRHKITSSGAHGSARFAKLSEIKRFLSKDITGPILMQTEDAAYKLDPDTAQPRKLLKSGKILTTNDPEHILIVAPTRRGKGVNNVIPSLISCKYSVVVYDIKKENYNLTAGFRSLFSHVLPFEPTSRDSIHWNPLFEIEIGDNEVAQTQNLCEMLASPFGSKDEGSHWKISAVAFLVGVVLHVLYAEKDKSLAGVASFISNPERPIRKSLRHMLEVRHTPAGTHPVVAEVARTMLDKEDAEFSGVVSSAISYLTLYRDPIVAQNTRDSDFAIKDLMNKEHPVSLYLIVSPQDEARLKPLIRLLLKSIANKLTAKLEPPRHKLLLLIDEFPSLGAIPNFEAQLAFFAGYGIRCMLITQSFGFLQSIYGQHTTIPDNCRIKVILGSDTPQEAKLVTEYLGSQTIERESQSKSAKNSDVFGFNRTVSTSEMGRTLLTPDEMLRFPFDQALLMYGGAYPYRGKKIFYYLDKRFQAYTKFPAPGGRSTLAKTLRTLKPSVPWLGLRVQSFYDTEEEAEPYYKPSDIVLETNRKPQEISDKPHTQELEEEEPADSTYQDYVEPTVPGAKSASFLKKWIK